MLVGVTNQPARRTDGHGRCPRGRASRVVDLLAAQDASSTRWRICLHHPRRTDPALGRVCECRKPAPGMLPSAAEELDIDLAGSWMIGDTDADVLAGRAAGCKTLLIETRKVHTKDPGSSRSTGALGTSYMPYQSCSVARATASIAAVLDKITARIFADGANLQGVLEFADDPRISGFTTNPTLMRQAGVTDYGVARPSSSATSRRARSRSRSSPTNARRCAARRSSSPRGARTSTWKTR